MGFHRYSEFISESTLDQFLFEGGAFGHMAHPYDDPNLTFGEIKDLISDALQGGLNKEVIPSEKLDGQAIAISWKDGQLVAARNKGHYRNGAVAAMSVQDVITKFEGRGDLADAFTFAVQDLESAISEINPADREKIFKNGKSFMHLELIYPKSTNVINYDTPKLIFHSATEYDEQGNAIGEDKESASTLTKLIKDVNADVQKNYEIDPPKAIEFSKNVNFESDRAQFFKELSKIQKSTGLKDNQNIGDYIRKQYTEMIEGAATKFGYDLAPNILDGLVNRFAFGDKSFRIPDIKKQITNKDFLKWALSFDKKSADYYKQVISPFEILFLKLGVKVIQLATGFLAVNPDKAVQTIKDELEIAIKQVKSSGSESSIKKLEAQLHKLEAIGGFDAVLPSEGIVFQHKGKTYKLTGAFAPVNQILGIFRYA